jgi:hypothetical protein
MTVVPKAEIDARAAKLAKADPAWLRDAAARTAALRQLWPAKPDSDKAPSSTWPTRRCWTRSWPSRAVSRPERLGRVAPQLGGDIRRPSLDPRLEARAIAGEQGPHGLLEARQVAADRRGEAIGRLARGADAVRALALTARGLDQLAQGHRRPARLAGQPVPVAWQQGDLARHHAQLRPPAPARRLGRRREAQGQSVRPAAEVEVDPRPSGPKISTPVRSEPLSRQGRLELRARRHAHRWPWKTT